MPKFLAGISGDCKSGAGETEAEPIGLVCSHENGKNRSTITFSKKIVQIAGVKNLFEKKNKKLMSVRVFFSVSLLNRFITTTNFASTLS